MDSGINKYIRRPIGHLTYSTLSKYSVFKGVASGTMSESLSILRRGGVFFLLTLFNGTICDNGLQRR